MSVESPQYGEMFMIAIHQRIRAEPSVQWKNTHVLRGEGGGAADLQAYAECLHRLSTRFLMNSCETFRVTVATHSVGQYNPLHSWSKDLSETGVSSGGDQLGLEHCLTLLRMPQFGRPSYIWVRHSMLRVSCTLTSGILNLSGAALNGRISALDYEVDRQTVPSYNIRQLTTDGNGFRAVIPSSKTSGEYRYIASYGVSSRVALVGFNRR
jgi:hypothetical protein